MTPKLFMQLSDHFSLHEATFSDKAIALGIDNTDVTVPMLATLSKTAVRLEKVRAALGFPIHVNSWFRCLDLNEAVGSKPTSQHLKGEAVDFTCAGYGTPVQVCKKLLTMKDVLRWDQLILEHTWIHISWNSIPDVEQRGQVLSLLSTGGYSQGLTDKSGQLFSDFA